MRLSLVSAVACLSLSAWSMADEARAAIKISMNIPAQGLAPALQAFATDHDLQLLYRSEIVGNVRTGGVVGEFTVDEALARLLSGTGLGFKYLDESTVTILPLATALRRSRSALDITERGGDYSAVDGAGGERELRGRFRSTQVALAAGSGTSASESDGAKLSENSAGKSAQSAIQVEEVVVTASKRKENLQDIPSAVSALSEQHLRNLSALGLEDYAKTVPSLTNTDMGTGHQKVSIRGINPTSGSSAAKLYLGEMPLPETYGNYGNGLVNPQLIDINRIEVLRGPQGTLYGAGSVGGTVRLIPNEPDLSVWSGYLQSAATTTQSGGPGYQASGVLNIPVAQERFGIRTAAWFQDQDGFIDREFPGGSAKNVPTREVLGARLIAAGNFSDALKLSAMILHERKDFGGIQDITGGATNPNDELRQVMLADAPESVDMDYTMYNVAANFRHGNFEWTASSSYVEHHRALKEEGTQVINAFFGDPPFPNVFLDESWIDGFTHEVRLNTIDRIGGWDFIVGLFYNKLDRENTVRWSPPGFSEALFPIPDDNLFTADITSFDKELAMFGEISYAVTEKLILTGGARRFEIKSGSGLFYNGLFNGLTTTDQELRSRAQGEVYKANLAYHVTDDHLLYATYSEGFRPGSGTAPLPDVCTPDIEALGFTTPPTQINPDHVKNYEIGLRSAWLDNRLTVNAAAYRMDWQDVQTSRFLPCGFGLGINSETGARVVGFEIETGWRVTDRLTMGVNAAIIDSQFNGNEQALGAFEGDPMQDVPEFEGALFFDYQFMAAGAWAALLHADASYSADSYSDFGRLADGITRDPLSHRGDLSLLNVRLSALRGNWEFALFGKNLLNDIERQERNLSAILDISERPRFVVNQPRTYGIDARWRF